MSAIFSFNILYNILLTRKHNIKCAMRIISINRLGYRIHIIIEIMQVANNQCKQRDSRKAKTSILFQVKHNNTDQNIEFGQSFNIISLNTPSRLMATHKRAPCQESKTEQNLSINRTMAKRAHQSSKLTLKINSGNNIVIDQENNRGQSLHQVPTYKKLQIGEVMDKIQKKHMITVEKNKVVTDFAAFSNIVNEFLQKIDGLQLENCELTGKVKKYQNYFKELKVKQTPQALDMILEPTSPSGNNNSSKSQSSNQLKILNLERKVQTLNYIIKNYRSNNKEQVRQFEKKVNEYKPTLQSQLVQMLSQSNKKCEQMSKIVEYFQKQYEQVYKSGNWVELVRNLKQKDEEINKAHQRINELEQQVQINKVEAQQVQVYRQQLTVLNCEIMERNYQLGELKKKHEQLNQDKNNKQNEYEELLRAKEELTYKYQALVPLQTKIKQKQEIIRKNSQAITRMQAQNYSLKNKIGSLMKNSESQLFNKQPWSVETIQKCSTTIQELSSRFSEQLDALPQQNKQLTSFMTHLFQKTKTSFEKIIEQYRTHLKQAVMECKQLRNHLDTMIGANKKKYETVQQILADIGSIDVKRKRCDQSHAKIDIREDCGSCVKWVLHWGQLNSLYGQQGALVKKLTEIE